MGRSKWTTINVQDAARDAPDTLATHPTDMDDVAPLVVPTEASNAPRRPSSSSSLNPLAVTTLGLLFLLVVILVIRGDTRHLPRRTLHWLEQLPPEMGRHVNPHVDPCDDFYAFSCGTWDATTRLPADRSSLSLAFTSVHEANDQVLKYVLEQGWPVVGELYASCMNVTNDTQADRAVLRPTLDAIRATQTKDDLLYLSGYLSKTGPDFVIGLSISADARNASVNALYASQTGLTLPDPVYYRDPTQYNALRNAFHAYVITLFRLAGWDESTAAAHTSRVLRFEETLATFYVPKETLQDPIASYTRVSLQRAVATYPHTLGHYLNGTGLLSSMLDDDDAYVIIETPQYFQQLEAFVTDATTTLETLQAVLTFHTLSTYAGALSNAFVEANFVFFGRTLRGQAARAPRWQVCVQTVSDKLPALVGKYYALVRFDRASHDVARDLMATMHQAWATTLPRVAWLDAATQQAATTKLRAMTTRLGHATQSEHVPYEIYADAPLATNLLTIRAHQFTVAVKKLGRPVDRTEWAMTSAEVNAYYQPRANQMVFPAGILQPPFFSKDYDPARNFGSIGSIVGHELTHGFDATGRHYDAFGTLHDWWSNETAHEFTKRTQCLVEQYGRYNVSSTTDPIHVLGHVNGQYTLSENIADNGGVKLAFHAYQAARATHNATGDKLFFLSFAQTFCAKRSDQAMTEKLASDPHAPERWRINGVASNSHDFARVFQCPATARMNPPTKCQVW